MLRKLQEELKTTEDFYTKFFTSKEGKLTLDTIHKKFTPINKNVEIDVIIDFVIESMQNWLFEQLTDDQMDSAYVWFDSLEPELREMIEDGLT